MQHMVNILPFFSIILQKAELFFFVVPQNPKYHAVLLNQLTAYDKYRYSTIVMS